MPYKYNTLSIYIYKLYMVQILIISDYNRSFCHFDAGFSKSKSDSKWHMDLLGGKVNICLQTHIF